jgi:predicted ferric reductase
MVTQPRSFTARPGIRDRLFTLLRPAHGDFGPFTMVTLVCLEAVLWIAVRPAGEPWRRHIGQMFGAESVLLLAMALVMISTLPWIETWFHGIDRAAIWHRRAVIVGLVLLGPHILLASNPDGSTLGGPLATTGAVGLVALALWSVLPRWRTMLPSTLRNSILVLRDTAPGQLVRKVIDNYEWWRTVHRTTGLFVAAGFVHGLLDATAFDASPALRWSYVAIGGTGLAFYVYREVLARHFLPFHDYQVATVTDLGDGLAEIGLTPLGQPLSFVPGQFVVVYFEAKNGWNRHPFTIASAPKDPVLRFTIKALGDFTRQVHTFVQPGMPAVISGPHGRFDYNNGTKQQVWIAAGVGITPFLSWLRSLDGDIAHEVDFFYTSRGRAPFANEVLAIADHHPTLRAHLVDTSAQGHLTPDQVLARISTAPADLSVFMCGPEVMLEQFEAAFRYAGVPRANIYREYFNIR